MKNENSYFYFYFKKRICSTVCVMMLQQNSANILIDNNLSNSIIGTCIASNHLNLFISLKKSTIVTNSLRNTAKLFKIIKNVACCSRTKLVSIKPCLIELN